MNDILDNLRLLYNFINSNIVYINVIIIIFIIFFQKREPLTIFLWIFVLIFIPIAGLIFYIFVGQQIRKERKFHNKDIEESMNKYSYRPKKALMFNQFKYNEDLSKYEDIINYNYNIANAYYTQNNSIKIIKNGNDKFDMLIKDILSAKKYIFMQYYIIKNDEVFNRIKKYLIRKSKQGVKICLIYDGMGCRLMKKRVWRELEKYGIDTVSFFPPIFGQLNIRANYRNHRKIVVIDGIIGYIGGFNIGKEYIGKDKRFGNWRDTHIKVIGEAVMGIESRFIMDWNYAIKNNSKKLKYKLNSYYPEVKDKVGIQIISAGPDTSEPIIRDNILKMIYSAKKNIKIATPYFIPDEAMITALSSAIYSGVKVEIMIPSISDHILVLHASHYFVGQLLEIGAIIHSYSDGFLHSKFIVVDDKICSIGSTNMDIRSFKLNFEINAVIYSKVISEKLSADFDEDVLKSERYTLDLYKNRSLYVRFLERLSRLFSPIM